MRNLNTNVEIIHDIQEQIINNVDKIINYLKQNTEVLSEDLKIAIDKIQNCETVGYDNLYAFFIMMIIAVLFLVQNF